MLVSRAAVLAALTFLFPAGLVLAKDLRLGDLLGRYRVTTNGATVSLARVPGTPVPGFRAVGGGQIVIRALARNAEGGVAELSTDLRGTVFFTRDQRRESVRYSGGFRNRGAGSYAIVDDAWFGLGGLQISDAEGGRVSRTRNAIVIRDARYTYPATTTGELATGRVDVKVSVRFRVRDRVEGIRIEHVAYRDLEGRIPAARVTLNAIRVRE